MQYKYKQLDIQTYISSLYCDGLRKSLCFDENIIKENISTIGLFKFKGYVKAFRDNLSNYSIDDILFLYDFDRDLSSNTFKLTSSIEIKIKTCLIESVYELTDNPFCYLLKENYQHSFKLSNDSLYDWEVRENRNRCAHNGRIFNRNYRSVKAIGKYKSIRKGLYDHRLLDVYYTLYFLLADESELQNSNDLENRFIIENFKSENQKMKEFVLNCMRKR